MRTVLSIAAAAALTLGLMTGSLAAEKGKAKAAGAPKCKACGMTLATKKSKEMSREVKIDGKTYYCCSACKMETGGKKGAAPKGKKK